MRRTLLSATALLVWLTSQAQNPAYLQRSDIPYYPAQAAHSDSYLRERCVLDVYYPKEMRGFPTVIWFHGGGLTGGNKEIPEGLKEKGLAVIAVNYRLSPRVKSPAWIEDAAAAIAWTFANIGSFGGDDSLVFVSGHSAGAYLTLMCGLDKKWLAAQAVDADAIAGLIPLSGQTITHFTIREEWGIPDTRPVVDELAPLYHVRSDAPPLLLITGDRELELLGRYEENAYLMRMMRVAGHPEIRLLELDGYGHDMVAPALPLLLKEIGRLTRLRRPDAP